MSTPFPVMPFYDGVRQDTNDFLMESTSFPYLEDCYPFRGRIERRRGNQSLGRIISTIMAGALGNTGASPFIANIITLFPAAILGISPRSVTINIAAPVGPAVYTDPNGDGILYLLGVASGTINYTSGAVSVTHGGGGASVVTGTFSYYSGLPVMGLYQWDTDYVNQETLIAFDTRNANIYNEGNLEFDDISFTTAGVQISWHSTDADFFWCTNYWRDSSYRILFWATNGVADRLTGVVHEDGIQIYNGVGWEWQECRLDAASTVFLRGCQILIPFKDHIIAMNTLEGAVQPAVPIRYPNRIRWCQNGIPYTTGLGGLDITAWESATPGKGGFGYIPTNEQIISASYWKDNLLIYCESSTWMLTFVGNTQYPFQLQKVNDHYGSSSAHSFVTTDKGIYCIGDKGIVIGDGFNVERIDLKIPDELCFFSAIQKADRRIHGVIDHYLQYIYWIFPSNVSATGQQTSQFPDQMLVYNMQDQAWSIFNDRFTCLGQYRYVSGARWEDLTDPWRTYNRPWNSFVENTKFPEVIAGNQQGFVFYLRGLSLSNSKSLAIRAITQAGQALITSFNHNLKVGHYVEISGVEGMTAINNLYARVQSTPTADTFTVNIDTTLFAPYTRGGYITFLNNINITTKSFNPFYAQGERPRLNYLDFYFDYAPSGEISVDIYNNDINSSALLETAITNTHKDFGGGFAIPRVWKRLFPDCEGQFFIIKLYLSDAQMLDKDIQESNICLHAMNMWMSSAGRLLSYDN